MYQNPLSTPSFLYFLLFFSLASCNNCDCHILDLSLLHALIPTYVLIDMPAIEFWEIFFLNQLQSLLMIIAAIPRLVVYVNRHLLRIVVWISLHLHMPRVSCIVLYTQNLSRYYFDLDFCYDHLYLDMLECLGIEDCEVAWYRASKGVTARQLAAPAFDIEVRLMTAKEDIFSFHRGKGYQRNAFIVGLSFSSLL